MTDTLGLSDLARQRINELANRYRARPVGLSPHKDQHKGDACACRCKGDHWCYCNDRTCWCHVPDDL
jgi:hypothetical protein